MISLVLVLALLVGHYIGDFMLQSDWMALNKSKDWTALVAHVAVYICTLTAVLAAVDLVRNIHGAIGAPDLYVVAFLLANAWAHLFQDAITSRINAKNWFFRLEPGIWEQAAFTVPRHERSIVNPWIQDVGDRHQFFVGIGLDQCVHYLTLFVTAYWWLK